MDHGYEEETNAICRIRDTIVNEDKMVLQKIDKLLDAYSKQVTLATQHGLMTEKTANTYLLHPNNFYRWCKGNFMPGEKNNKIL